MKKVTKLIVSIITIYLIPILAYSQVIPFNDEQWEIKGQGKAIEGYKGEKALYLHNGKAVLKDVDFEDGIIEFDIYMQEKRGFSGVFFRMVDDKNFEEIYLRSHHSTHPDAFQYTPIFNGLAGWQLYHDQYGLINSTGIIDHYLKEGNMGYNGKCTYYYDRWMHFKVVISGDEAEMFFEDEKEPFLHIYDLKREKSSGEIGVFSNVGGAHFANFSYQKMSNPPLVIKEKRSVKEVAGAILDWELSEPFDFKTVSSGSELEKGLIKKQKWQSVKAVNDGLLNIAEFAKIGKDQNTVFLKYVLDSKSSKTQKMTFGYSDETIIYVNGVPLYQGQNRFLSRDYRYLGTIGYFDQVFLPLKKGQNEIIIVVKENFGGWGFQAKLE